MQKAGSEIPLRKPFACPHSTESSLEILDTAVSIFMALSSPRAVCELTSVRRVLRIRFDNSWLARQPGTSPMIAAR